MTDPTGDNVPERSLGWLKHWGWIWAAAMLIIFGTLFAVDRWL